MPDRPKKNMKLNTLQLATLRRVEPGGLLLCDRSVGKALVARGFAVERDSFGTRQGHGTAFFITSGGRDRALQPADVIARVSSPEAHRLTGDLLRPATLTP